MAIDTEDEPAVHSSVESPPPTPTTEFPDEGKALSQEDLDFVEKLVNLRVKELEAKLMVDMVGKVKLVLDPLKETFNSLQARHEDWITRAEHSDDISITIAKNLNEFRGTLDEMQVRVNTALNSLQPGLSTSSAATLVPAAPQAAPPTLPTPVPPPAPLSPALLSPAHLTTAPPTTTPPPMQGPLALPAPAQTASPPHSPPHAPPSINDLPNSTLEAPEGSVLVPVLQNPEVLRSSNEEMMEVDQLKVATPVESLQSPEGHSSAEEISAPDAEMRELEEGEIVGSHREDADMAPST